MNMDGNFTKTRYTSSSSGGNRGVIRTAYQMKLITKWNRKRMFRHGEESARVYFAMITGVRG